MNQSLQEVEQLFIEWRQQKKYLREKIPENLWQAAVQLVPQHSIPQVTRQLKIKVGPFKQKLEKYHSSTDPSSQPVSFVEVNLPLNRNQPSSFSSPRNPLHCDRVEIQRKDGSRLTLYRQEDQAWDGKALIEAFLGGHHASNCPTE